MAEGNCNEICSMDGNPEAQKILRAVRGHLNNLCNSNEKLIEQVTKLNINNKENLQAVADLIFDMGVENQALSVKCAYACKGLAELQVPSDNQNELEKYVNFRKLLIQRCQLEFEKIISNMVGQKLELNELDKDKLKIEEEERRNRKKSVGTVRFIGELFKLGMLTTNIMMKCLKKLLQSIEEESLECLCKLLTTIGRDLELNKKQNLQQHFNKMQEIIDGKYGNISNRTRFLLQDVIQLRMNNWIKHTEQDSGVSRTGVWRVEI